MAWLSELAYAPMESCRGNWFAASWEVADVSTEVEALSVDVSDVDNLALLLKR